MELSVIIPTYKRPLHLLRALESLRGQSLPEYEVLIVDNAASPEIEQLVLENALASKNPIKYISEPKLGAHYARHAGARAAKGKLLVFTDDDATFDTEWLQAYARAFADYPQMAASGGPVRPLWEAAPPRWLEKYVSHRLIFPILSLMEPHEEFSVEAKGFFFSVNMAIRRTILFEVGGFNPDTFGEVWLGNGEVGLNHKLWEREMLVGYVPDAIAYHYIPVERMTVEYFKRRMENEGASDMYTRFHQKMPGQLRILWHTASIMVRNSMFWLIARLVSGRTEWLSLRVQLQAARSRGQFKYVTRLMRDKDFRKLVLKQDWLNDPCISG